jgi:hypothetical protein
VVSAAHEVLLDLKSLIIHFYSLLNHEEILCSIKEEELLGLTLVSESLRVEEFSRSFQILRLDRESFVIVLMGQIEELIWY